MHGGKNMSSESKSSQQGTAADTTKLLIVSRQWCLCQWQWQPQQLLYLNYSEDWHMPTVLEDFKVWPQEGGELAFRGNTSAGGEIPMQGRELQEHAPQQKPG